MIKRLIQKKFWKRYKMEEQEQFVEAINAEIVEEEEKPGVPAVVSAIIPKKKGKLSLKYRTIAEYAARGYSVELIAERIGITKGKVYNILETNELVWEEINRILTNIFADGDRMIANLRIKALKKLDDQLDSLNGDLRDKAIEKILKCSDYSKGDLKGAVIQFFGPGGKSEASGIQSIDDIILQKRKERGLLEGKKKE